MRKYIGGAALSVRQITGQPILFVGTGEKPEALEAFQPERMASRILAALGDVHARSVRHVLVHDVVNAPGDLRRRQTRFFG